VLPVSQFFVKSPVFVFNKFPGVDPALGPEMRSTGEVMGIGENGHLAFNDPPVADFDDPVALKVPFAGSYSSADVR